MLVKKCEDDNSFIIRLLETEGKDTAFMLEFNGRRYPIQIGHEEILTLKIEENAQQPVTEVNLLEWTLKKTNRQPLFLMKYKDRPPDTASAVYGPPGRADRSNDG